MGNTNSIYHAKLAAPQTNPTAASVFLTQDSVTANAAASSYPTQAAVVYLPEVQVDNYNVGSATKWPLGARAFDLKLWGRVSAGTSGAATFAVQIGKSTTPGSNVTLFTGGGPTYNLLGEWLITATLTYDPTSKLLTGSFSSQGGTATVIVANAAITAQTVDLSTGKLPLCVTALCGTSNANNVVYLDEFTLGVI